MRFQFIILIALFLVAIAFVQAATTEEAGLVVGAEEIVEAGGLEPFLELESDGEAEGENDDDDEENVPEVKNDEELSPVEDEDGSENDDDDSSGSDEDSASLEEDGDSEPLKLKPQARPLPEALRKRFYK